MTRSTQSLFRLPAALIAALTLTAGTHAEPATDARALLRQRFVQDGSAEVRAAAARFLAPVGEAAALEHLIEVLDADATGTAPLDAVAGLAAVGGAENVARLVATITASAQPGTRAAAARAALDLAPEAALEAAGTLLTGPDGADQLFLAQVLADRFADTPDARAVSLLVAAYRLHGADTFAGPDLLAALSALSYEELPGLVRTFIDSAEPEDAAAVFQQLDEVEQGWVGPLALDYLGGDGPAAVRAEAAKVAALFVPDDLGPRAVELAADAGTPLELRVRLVDLLGSTGYGGAAALLQDLLDGDVPELRAPAARTLGRLGVAGDRLIELLGDTAQPAGLRAACAEGLGYTPPSEESTAALVRALLEDESGSVAEDAAMALARSGTPEGLDRLRKAAGTENRQATRLAAVTTTFECDHLVAEASRIALGDPDEKVRWRATVGLGLLPGEERLAALIAAFDQGDAFSSLAFFMLTVQDDWAPRIVDRCVRVLRGSESADDRLGAAVTLGVAGGEDAAEALARASAHDPDANVRLFSMVSVPKDFPVLARDAAAFMLVRDADSRNRLFGAARLTHRDPAGAFGSLRKAALRDRDPGVRRWVMLALGAILDPAREVPSALLPGLVSVRDRVAALRTRVPLQLHGAEVDLQRVQP